MGFKFEKLDVWNRALELSHRVHELTKKFPKDELYVLSSQIKRASDSIVLNIAEGSTSQSNAEFKQFLNYAMRSGVEVVASLFIAKKRQIITPEDFEYLYSETEVIVKMIQGLRKSLK